MKLTKQSKSFILLSILTISFQACSDNDQKNGLTDPTAKAADVAADDIPMISLGKDGAIIAKVDIPFPEGENTILLDNNKIEQWSSVRGVEEIGLVRPVCSFWKETSSSAVSKGDLLGVSSTEFDIAIDQSKKIVLEQSIYLRNKDGHLFALGCSKPLTSVVSGIFTIGNFKSIASNYFEVSDLEKNLPLFAVTQKAEEGSLFSKIAIGSTLTWKGSKPGHYQKGLNDTERSIDQDTLYAITYFSTGLSAQIKKIRIQYANRGSNEKLSLKLTVGSQDITWYLNNLNNLENSKNFPLKEYLDQTGVDSIEIDGSPLSFGLRLR